MTKFLTAIFAGLLLLTPALATSASLGNDLFVRMPFGWEVISDTNALPVHLSCDPFGAQMSIFRSEFAGSDRVSNQEELKKSVQKVIDEVILTLPDAKLLTSSGFDHGNRAGFILEFTSTDTTVHLPLRHRFEGVLYRVPDGKQYLFTLWAKAPAESFPLADSSIRVLQGSFEYNGPHEATVFGSDLNPYVILAVLVLLAIGLIYYGRSRRYARTSADALNTSSESPHQNFTAKN